jgi:hypothetical protein
MYVCVAVKQDYTPQNATFFKKTGEKKKTVHRVM